MLSALPATFLFSLLLLSQAVACFDLPFNLAQQHPLLEQHAERLEGVSFRFFVNLERLSRLVDIAYCVGTTGLSRPFACASRCKDFPTLELVTTWNTGVLMSDSCGYIAVDHGARLQPESTTNMDGDVNANDSKLGAIIVAFRGTYSITNTVVDLSTIPQEYVPYPSPEEGGDEPVEDPKHRCTNCTVHMGFLTSWKMARGNVLSTLKPLHSQYPNYPIHLVGHSLGGAVAVLASLELRVILGWDKVIVTTFGEPRVGNDGFVRYVDTVFDLKNNQTDAEERTYRRLTHVDDPVPLLPLSEWGYRSHAGEIFISKADLAPTPADIRTCVGDNDPRCSAGSAGEILDPSKKLIAFEDTDRVAASRKRWDIPTRLKLWQLFFAHRDYFWRLGLCVPGGDPIDWGRDKYPNVSLSGEE